MNTFIEHIITFPDTLEVKEIKNGEIILVEKEKKLTYADVAKNLFDNNYTYYIQRLTIGQDMFTEGGYCEGNTFTSEKQAEKLLAINKLMNVAKYLNGDWQPNLDFYPENKYIITIVNDKIEIENVGKTNYCNSYFKSRELAEQAIEILGEDTIRLAFCTDY